MTDPTQEQVEAAKAAILAAFNGEAMPKDDNEAAGVLATAAIAALRPWMRGEVAAWEVHPLRRMDHTGAQAGARLVEREWLDRNPSLPWSFP